MFSAVLTSAPIANISDKEFAAAIFPYINGSSTTGVIKSTVWTNASFSFILKTEASSLFSNPTSTFSLSGISERIVCFRSPGPIFAAQPAA